MRYRMGGEELGGGGGYKKMTHCYFMQFSGHLHTIFIFFNRKCLLSIYPHLTP